MNFYPKLFEEETTIETTQADLKKAIGKYVGAISGNIKLDPHDDSIISVNKRRENTPIDTWEEIEELKLYKNYLISFLEKTFKDNDVNIDINKVLSDIRKNNQKEREQAKGKSKSWVPLKIPLFPLQGLKYKDFWDYQLNVYNDEINNELDKIRKNKEIKNSKYSAKDVDGKVSKLIVSPILSEYYNEKGKKKEWDNFISNVEKSGLSTIGSLNQLLDIMSKVIEGNIEPNTIYGATRVKMQLNNEEDIQKWKDDMIKYISKYNNKSINNINDDGTYLNEILNIGSFLNILLVTEPKGVGRGEILMSYIMKDAKFAGGNESYDVTCDNTTYELKDYSDVGGSIRLGTHGKLTRFEWWKEIEKTVNEAKKILNEIGDEKLKSILNDSSFFTIWKYMTSDKSYLQDKRIISTAVEAGEINTERLERLKTFYCLAHELSKKETPDEKGKYTYMTIKGHGVKPETFDITPIKDDDLEKLTSINIEGKAEDESKLKKLFSFKYVKDPLQLQKDLDNIGKEYNKGANNVDYFMVFFPKKIIIEKPDDFVFDTISQSAVKIIHKDDRSISKGEQSADKAFKKWEKQKEKSYYEIYKDVIHGDDNETNESYYTVLRNN